jgi:hypothetical protein
VNAPIDVRAGAAYVLGERAQSLMCPSCPPLVLALASMAFPPLRKLADPVIRFLAPGDRAAFALLRESSGNSESR